jgi:hypothetical protein
VAPSPRAEAIFGPFGIKSKGRLCSIAMLSALGSMLAWAVVYRRQYAHRASTIYASTIRIDYTASSTQVCLNDMPQRLDRHAPVHGGGASLIA